MSQRASNFSCDDCKKPDLGEPISSFNELLTD